MHSVSAELNLAVSNDIDNIRTIIKQDLNYNIQTNYMKSIDRKIFDNLSN